MRLRRRHHLTAAMLIVLLVSLCLNLFSTPTADAFASNLIVTSMGCMTDLSTDEVIMNNEVKAAADSDFPKMHLVVIDSVNKNYMESPYHYSSQELTIAFVNPYTPEEFSEDIQFVMEVDGPASFIEGGTIGCENDKRVAARWMDDDGKVVLKIHDMSAKLRVWAGWATGQNPVRLTPELNLEPASVPTKQKEEEEDTKATERKEYVEVLDASPKTDQPKNVENPVQEELPSPDANVAKPLQNLLMNKRVPEELDNIDPLVRSIHHNTKQKIIHRGTSRSKGNTNAGHLDSIVQKVKEKHGLDLAAATDRTKKVQVNKAPPTKADDRTDDDNNRRRRESERKMQGHRSKLEAQMLNDFGNAANDLSMSSHLLGCVFFVVCMGGFLLFFGKKRDKGRRDL
jgi:hypothetical protein